MSKVVIYGNSDWVKYLHYCLTHDSMHQVVGFTVDAADIKENALLGLPVVAFEDVGSVFPPSEYKMLVALGCEEMNKQREKKYLQAKTMGYELISYISSKASVAADVDIGDNCLVLESSLVHPFVKIGNDVVIGASALVGHHTIIKEHAFISSAATILGLVGIGERCYIGAHATITQGVQIDRECLIGINVSITNNAKSGSVYSCPPAELMQQSSEELIPFISWC